ncbi:MAG: inositol-3-phosphate synthase [Crenarchaeota archaeon]|nr:inositol-3-phosphate synthase [Thermoproteota archaeon]MDW8033682.1 inositol-3-phosphate synthase [Nitrososphaerota archaeon]
MPKGKIRVAFIGIGNSASTTIQGLFYYSSGRENSGLWHPLVGGYGVGDIEVVAALDIDSRKVGKDLSEAIFSEPNVVEKRCEVPRTSVIVEKGLLEDELNPYLASKLEVSKQDKNGVVECLKKSDVDVVVNTISSGLDKSSIAYANAACEAGASFVNATPTSIATDPSIIEAFKKRGVIVVGDDLMSQLGGTALHRGLVYFLKSRGIKPIRSYQLDVGGGLETLNTMYEDLRDFKKQVKTSSIGEEINEGWEVVSGTTDYVDFLGNNRVTYLQFNAIGFMGSSITINVSLRSNDGMNASNIILDVIRAVKKASEDGLIGNVNEISNYGFKKTLEKKRIQEATMAFESKYCRF